MIGLDAQIMHAALAETNLTGDNSGEDNGVAAHAEDKVADPTIANAGLTEIEAKPLQTNGLDTENSAVAISEQASIDPGAANATAEEQWDSKITSAEGLGESFEIVSKNGAEAESKPIPLSNKSTQSWADDNPVDPPVARDTSRVMANGNDGFREVHHGRGGRGRGSYYGDYRGGYRGRYRGDNSGYRNRGYRGRGGFRGGGRGRDNSNTIT